MTNIMTSLFVDVHQSNAKPALFRTSNCFLIASTLSVNSLRQMLLRVIADCMTRSSHNALCDRRSSRFDTAFHGICDETHANMRSRVHVSWCNSDLSQSSAAILERLVCQFGQYGLNWISIMLFLCKLTIVIPQLPCLFRMSNALSSTIEPFNSVTSVSVTSFNFAIWAVASRWFPIVSIPRSNEWWRTWWQMIHMMPGLLDSSIQQCK